LGLASRGTRVRKLLGQVWRDTIEEEKNVEKARQEEIEKERNSYLLPIEKVNFAAEEMATLEGHEKKTLSTMQIPVAFYDPSKTPMTEEEIKKLRSHVIPSSTIGREYEHRI